MTTEELTPIVEAVLFAGGEPTDLEKLCETVEATGDEVKAALDVLEKKYSDKTSGIQLLKLENSYQLATKKEYSDYIKKAFEIKKNTVLSPAAMEALTIIAYNQPVTKGFVESVRGVDSSGVVNSLAEKGLIVETGRLNLPGRPIAYKTTDNFLRVFQISSLDELPPLPESKSQITMDDVIKSKENADNTTGNL